MLSRRLELFIAVAEEKSIRSAAKNLFMTQPSLSQQIRSLEQAMGVPLIKRTNRGIQLTEAGEILHDEGKDLQARSATIARQIKSISNGPQEVLLIGMNPLHREFISSDVCSEFIKAYPEVKVSFISVLTGEIPTAIAEGAIDVAEFCSSSALEANGCLWEKALSMSVSCLVPKSHPIATRDIIFLKDLCGEQIAIYREGAFCSFDKIRKTIEDHCDSISFVDLDVNEPPEYGTMRGCLTIVPSLHSRKVVNKSIPLAIPNKISRGFAYGNHPSKTTSDFINLARKLIPSA